MSDFQTGKEIGGILERLKALEAKAGCGCGSASAGALSFKAQFEEGGPASISDKEPDGHLHQGAASELLPLSCGSNGHLSTTNVPPEPGYPSTWTYCLICCNGRWTYVYGYVNGQKIYAARGGYKWTVNCGGSNYICGC